MIRSIVFRPDITEMVDWAFKTNYLPTYHFCEPDVKLDEQHVLLIRPRHAVGDVQVSAGPSADDEERRGAPGGPPGPRVGLRGGRRHQRRGRLQAGPLHHPALQRRQGQVRQRLLPVACRQSHHGAESTAQGLWVCLLKAYSPANRQETKSAFRYSLIFAVGGTCGCDGTTTTDLTDTTASTRV